MSDMCFVGAIVGAFDHAATPRAFDPSPHSPDCRARQCPGKIAPQFGHENPRCESMVNQWLIVVNNDD